MFVLMDHELVKYDTDDDKKHRVQYCVTFCLDYLDFKGLVKIRTITKVLVPLVSGPSFWNRISDMQEKRERNGKRLLLFNQYLMSRKQAARLLPSSKYH